MLWWSMMSANHWKFFDSTSDSTVLRVSEVLHHVLRAKRRGRLATSRALRCIWIPPMSTINERHRLQELVSSPAAVWPNSSHRSCAGVFLHETVERVQAFLSSPCLATTNLSLCVNVIGTAFTVVGPSLRNMSLTSPLRALEAALVEYHA